MSLNNLNLKNYNYVFIEDVDYENIEMMLRNNLVGLCWGTENEDYYDINDVIDEFLDRFFRKSEEQQFGYIGEFLYYLYILNNADIISPVSIFFNQEEKSFKKGFDLLGYDGSELWYSEVKSGEKKEYDIDSVNLERLSTAYRDIKDKLRFINRNTNYWDTAKSNICKIKVNGIISDRNNVVNILTTDRVKENIKNVIIVSVIFDNSTVDLNVRKIKEKYDNIKSQRENITIVCIRKKTIDKIIEIIKGVRTSE